MEVNNSPIVVALKSAIVLTVKAAKSVYGEFKNIRGKECNISNIPIMSPYGQGSIPPNNLRGLLIPIIDSEKSVCNMGYHTVVPPCAHTFATGESWSNSQNYVLAYQINGIIGYRVSDDTYAATLPSGEWMNYLFLHRIQELTDIINEINNNYASLKTQFDAHIHPSGTPNTGTPTVPLTQTDLPMPPELAQDKSDIEAGKDLIKDGGTNPPSEEE